jgi:general secretion pathway protein M
MNLQERFDNLAERERKLLLIFFGVLGVMLLFLLPLLIRMGVSEQSERNDRIREVISMIEDERLTLNRRNAEVNRIEGRYRRQTPALAGFLAKKADDVGVEIPETQDRSTVPRGKTFKERASRIRLSKVGMLELSNFMNSITNSGYPVSISRLDIKKRGGKPDTYDVEMDVSAYDKEEKKEKKSKKGSAKEEAQ